MANVRNLRINNLRMMTVGAAVFAAFTTVNPQPVFAQSAQLWSDVFGNAGANATVHITQDQTILIDQDIDVGGIIIEGELIAQDTRDLSVSTEWALVTNGGMFQVGSENDPFENNFTLTLTGDNPNRELDLVDQVGMRINNNDAFLMGMGNGSRIELFGADAQKRSWTQVTRTVEAGAQSLFVAGNTGWEVGDRIAIASTSSLFDEAEELTIQSIDNADGGQRIDVEETIQNRHYGEVERYDNGARTWDFDMRAEVGLLSRNVTITGDENANQDQFGGHLMVSNNASLRISGTELARMGQFGILGRYPAHWHLLGDTSNQYIENSSVHHSFNKGVTIHGTNDVSVDNNVVFDTLGHSIFLEDGNEIRTSITDNLVFMTRNAPQGASVPTDVNFATSYWIEHPNNILTGNVGAGAAEAAFWIFDRNPPHGDAQGQPAAAGSLRNLVFNNNTAHSSAQAFFVEGEIRNDLTFNRGQLSPLNNQPAFMSNLRAYQIRNPNQGAVWIRSRNFTIQNVMVADSTEGVFFEGNSYLQDALLVSESQGNSEEWQEGRRQKGVRMYFPRSSAISDVHFVGFNEINDHANGIVVGSDAALMVRGSRTHNVAAHVRGLSFDDTTVDNTLSWDTTVGNVLGNVRNNITSRIVDHDGSLGGTPATLIAPNNRAAGAQQVEGIGFPLGGTFRSPIGNLLSWNDVLEAIFTGSPAPTDLRDTDVPVPAPAPTPSPEPAPAPSTEEGVTLHRASDFGGASVTVGAGTYPIGFLINSVIGNDQLSSLTIPEGWSVEACQDHDFGGRCITYVQSISLTGFDNEASSLRVIAP